MKPVWRIRLAKSAERDYANIIDWTLIHFGQRQATTYAETITRALKALTTGPQASGAKLREDIGPNLYTLHVARKGRKGRHFVMFRIEADQRPPTIDALRLLHDSMDLPRHVPTV